jgi:hypothetical protein
LEPKLHNLRGKGLGVVLINRIAGQADIADTRRDMAIPVDDLIQMMERALPSS